MVRGLNRRNSVKYAFPLIAVSLASQACGQSAASAEGDGIGEIVVTAQRRDQSIQDVPISITAFTQQKLDRQGVRDIQDVVRLTPGLNFARGGKQQLSNISIRGIRANGGASTTGIYLDDVAIQSRRVGFSGGSTFPQAFDLERIEVLRGPQGTLFGAGSQGGTVRFITPAPSLTKSSVYGRAELSSTRFGGIGYEAGVAVGVPIVEDKIGVRASGWYRHTAGYVDRVNARTGALRQKNANDGETYSGRIAVKFAPTETIEITPSFFYQREHADDVSTFYQHLSDPAKGRFLNGNEIAAPNTDKFYVPSLTVAADVTDEINVVSVTSYLHRDQALVADYTQNVGAVLFRTPIRPEGRVAPNYFNNTQRSWSQEVRLQSDGSGQSVRWVLGAFYQKSKQNATQINIDNTVVADFLAITGRPFASAFGQNPVNGVIYQQDPFRTVDTQIAAFGQVDVDILPDLTATVGLRVAHTKFSFLTSISGPFGGAAFTDSGRQSEKPVTPKFGLEYRFTRDNSFYASVSKGYRVGGSNARQLSICQAQLNTLGLGGINPTTYDSDSVWSYEVGSKNQLFDRRVKLNASVFYIDWSNIQQFVTLSSCGGGFIGNLGKAVSKGFDIEFAASPIEGLTFTAAAGYTHGKFKNTVYAATPRPGSAAVSAGDRLQGSPLRLTFSAEYRYPLESGAEIYGRADYQHSSREPRNVPQVNPNNGLNRVPIYFGAPETNFVSTRVGAVMGPVDVSLFVDNLFQSEAILDGQNQNGSFLNQLSTFRPRTIGLTAAVRY